MVTAEAGIGFGAGHAALASIGKIKTAARGGVFWQRKLRRDPSLAINFVDQRKLRRGPSLRFDCVDRRKLRRDPSLVILARDDCVTREKRILWVAFSRRTHRIVRLA
jgi:hypothetical protein